MTATTLPELLDQTTATLRPIADGDDLDGAIALRWRIIRAVAVAAQRSSGHDARLVDDFNRFTGEPYAGVATHRDDTIFTADQMDGGPWMWAIVDSGYRNVAFGILGDATGPDTAQQVLREATDLLTRYLTGAAVADLPTEGVPQPDVAADL